MTLNLDDPRVQPRNTALPPTTQGPLRPMKICLFSNFFLPGVGGVERTSHNLADGWRALGHEVIVVTARPAGDFDDSALNFPVARPPLDRVWKELLPGCDVLVSNGLSLRFVRQWRRVGVPFGWIHSMELGASDTLRHAMLLNLRRVATRLGDFNICVSHSMKRHIRNRHAVVIHNAVDPLFRVMPDVPPTGRFLFFGRMWMPKGMDTLLHAIAELRSQGVEAPTDLVGEGPDLPAAQAIARDLKIEHLVRFMPFQAGDALVRTLNAARAVIVPSNWNEPFGLVAVESMACGRCVVGSRTGGLQEILEGYAPMFTPGNSHELAAAMLDLHLHPEKLRQYEHQALVRATHFRLLPICQLYLDVFEKAIHARGRRPRVAASRVSP